MTIKKITCPRCGAQVSIEDTYCFNCRKNLRKIIEEVKEKEQGEKGFSQLIESEETFPLVPRKERNPKREFKARYMDRVMAFAIDGLILGLCPPLFCFRDVIPERGKSFGKAVLFLKIVDYDTLEPITVKQACIRTACLISIIDLFYPLIDKEGRRIGDILANSIVLEDK
ncbi:MAG: RDD family protein [Candidatus Heimdallarchaeaceae archaeon]